MPEYENAELTALTADIVAAYVSHNNVSVNDLPAVIASTHGALAGLAKSAVAADATPAEAEFKPAVTRRKSLADPQRIISMIDGKPYAALKRHLATHGVTPKEYRARYNLPADYPMVAPGYSQARRDMAKKIGLGRKPAAKPAARPRTAKAARER
ncbi:MAG TPA: MucR family transcriptional regulator [Allosphingosinicella sp.]|jgi:predicted transcriptional regulator